MSFRPCPKPQPTMPKPRKWLPRATKPLKRSWAKRSTKPVRERNERRIARKAKQYRVTIGSNFNRELRYLAYQRSGGLCECPVCMEWRKAFAKGGEFRTEDAAAITLAHTEIPCWFVAGGGKPWRRFRSTDGELHHGSYKYFGQENPAELDEVEWTWKVCHRRIESEHGTRRRFLSGGK